MYVLSWTVSHTLTIGLSSGQHNNYATVDVLNCKLFSVPFWRQIQCPVRTRQLVSDSKDKTSAVL